MSNDRYIFITYDYLKQLDPCTDVLKKFKRVFPDGGEYQKILDYCAANNLSGWGRWLLAKIGPTNDVLEYTEELIDASLEIMFAGRVVFKLGATLKRIIAGALPGCSLQTSHAQCQSP